MKLSKWIKKYDFGDLIGLYHPYTIKKSFVSREKFEKIKNGEDDEKLRKQGMLVEEGEDDKLKNYIFEAIREQQPSPRIKTAYWIVTENCNLNCDYCFIPERKNMMDEETAIKCADTFLDLSEDEEERDVIFYGGEPLLGKEIVKNTAKYLSKFENIEFSLNTNGTLITPEIADFLKEYNFNVAVSIDGREEEHNQLRDKFKETIKGYKFLKERDLPVTISCTIGEHNLNNLPEITEFFAKELNTDSLGFNIPICKPDENLQKDSVKMENIADGIIEAYKVARENGVYEDRIMRCVEAFAEEDFRVRDCAGYGGQVVFSPEGKIGPCHGFLYNRKYFSDKYDPKVFEEWNKRITVNMEDCEDCAGIALCGGGCAYHSELTDGSIWNADKRYCTFVNEVLDFLMEDLYQNIDH